MPSSFIDQVVRYLHDNDVQFRLYSMPSPEPLPAVAHALPPGGMMVRTSVMLIDGRPAVACVPAGEDINWHRVSSELHTTAVEGGLRNLGTAWEQAGLPIPPLGGLLGVPLFIDEALSTATSITFLAFSNFDYFEVPFEAFSLLERPRVSPLAVGGMLPESQAPGP